MVLHWCSNTLRLRNRLLRAVSLLAVSFSMQCVLIRPRDFCFAQQTNDAIGPRTPTSKFQIIKEFDHPILERYRHFLADNGTHIAGLEFILDKDGELYTYDINTNTNYNQTAETEAGVSGMRRIAEYLGDQLAEVAVEGVDERQVNTG